MTNTADLTPAQLRAESAILHAQADDIHADAADEHRAVTATERAQAAMLRSEARELTALARHLESGAQPVGLGDQAMTREMGSTPVADELPADELGEDRDEPTTPEQRERNLPGRSVSFAVRDQAAWIAQLESTLADTGLALEDAHRDNAHLRVDLELARREIDNLESLGTYVDGATSREQMLREVLGPDAEGEDWGALLQRVRDRIAECMNLEYERDQARIRVAELEGEYEHQELNHEREEHEQARNALRSAEARSGELQQVLNDTLAEALDRGVRITVLEVGISDALATLDDPGDSLIADRVRSGLRGILQPVPPVVADPKPITFATSGGSSYSDHPSDCCGDAEHRPAWSTGDWYCQTCGTARADHPVAVRA